MKKPMIGIQSLIICPEIEKHGIFETMKKCAEIGYRCYEISQIPMTPDNIAQMQRAREELGVRIGAMSALVTPLGSTVGDWVNPFDNLQEDFDKIVADCRAVGCETLRIGILPKEILGSYEDVQAFAKETDVMAKRLKAEGIDMYYHTHHLEFGKFRGKYVLDIIKENTRHVGFELDTHWIQRGGENPERIIRRYAGRVRLLHLKDYRINCSKCVEGGWMAPDTIEYAEVGEGNLPMKECIEAGIESGCEYFFVEQDECYGRTPLESLIISYDNLVAMGYGDLF